MKNERGASLIETVVALALLGIIGVAFLGGLTTSSKARLIADEHVTARILAESQMEEIRKQVYAPSYTTTESILAAYPGYSIPTLQVVSLGNGNIQKITIIVSHRSKDIFTLESYKVDRG